MHIFIFGIKSNNFKRYSKGVLVIISINITNNFNKVIKQIRFIRKVNSLQNIVGQEVSKVLMKLGSPLIGKFKQPLTDKVILLHYGIHKKSKYSRVEKLIPLIWHEQKQIKI